MTETSCGTISVVLVYAHIAPPTHTMEDFGTLVTQLREVTSDTDKTTLRRHLPDLLEVVRECGRILDLDVQKKMHELIFARNAGLEVLEQQHGADMRDPKSGQVFEHKSVKVNDLDTSKQCNVNIKLPKWPTKASREDYAELAHNNVLSKGDVLIEGRVVSSTEHNYTVRLRAKFMARFAKEYVLRKVSKKRLDKINIGGPACATCHRIHRVDQLRKDSRRFRQLVDDDWKEIVTRKVASQCDEDEE